MSKINVDLLPTALRELVRALGEKAAFKLVESRGGGRLIVPKRVSLDHPLAEDIGPAAFVALVEHFGNLTLDLPKYDGVLRQLRHRKVRQLRGQGKTMDQVAVVSGYTRRHVINILASDPSDHRQLDMFDEPAGPAAAAAPAPAAAPAKAVRAHDPFGLAWRGRTADDDLD